MFGYLKWVSLNAIACLLIGLGHFINGAAFLINGIAQAFDGAGRAVSVARNRHADSVDEGFVEVEKDIASYKGLN